MSSVLGGKTPKPTMQTYLHHLHGAAQDKEGGKQLAVNNQFKAMH